MTAMKEYELEEINNGGSRDGPRWGPKGAWAPPGPKKKNLVTKFSKKKKNGKELGPPLIFSSEPPPLVLARAPLPKI